MISTFDITKLNALLKDFYNLTQIRITIFDENFHELAAYPENIAPFCQIIRTDEAGRNECQHWMKMHAKLLLNVIHYIPISVMQG